MNNKISLIMNIIKKHTEFICAILYAMLPLRFHRKPRRIVIYYHCITRKYAKCFERQMAFLAKKCTVVKASDILTYKAVGKKTIVSITFDDAYECIKEIAMPILNKYNLPATIFVPLGNMGHKPEWDIPDTCPYKNEFIMNEHDIKELDLKGYEMLAHSFSHRLLTNIETSSLKDEILRSKNTLEALLGHEVSGMSYPNGAHNDKICEAAKQAGYQYGFTIEPYMADYSPSNMEIGRFSVEPYEGLLTFQLKIIGAYQVTRYLRNIKSYLMKITRYLTYLWNMKQ
ncbi:MAG: polysaccharide deacetylase family protein [Sedimentisphaerales bacterium]|nr:polysaccharide deacetylase family protein [Sedimentisphaerales bacterium]